MKLEIDKDLAERLDQEALVLIEKLSPEPAEPNDSAGIFRPNYLVPSVDLIGNPLPFNPVQTVIDISGNEIARFFSDLKPPKGFAEQNHQKFITLCKQIQDLEEFNSKVSLTFLVETIFDWVKQRHENLTSKNMTEYLLSLCDSEVKNQEVWIPLAGTEVEDEIDLGNVTVKPISNSEWRRWISEWNARQPSALKDIKGFFSSIGTKRISVAVIKVTADPIKAVEKSIAEVERALVILRYFSPANFNPSMHTYCTISGTEYVERPRHILLRNGIPTAAGSTDLNLRSRHPWKIDASLLSNMKARGFDTLVSLNSREEKNRTPFQNLLLRGLDIYSKSSLAQNLSDKLLYVVVALEYLFLKNNIEPLQKNISERMALLIGRTLEERQNIIKNYKEAYALRSATVHHGATLTESKTVEDFMRDAWWTLNKLVEYVDRFQTKEDMITYVDDIKFTK